MSKVIERLGLDWLVILIGKPAFEDAPLPHPTTLSEAREGFRDLEGEKLDDALEYCDKLLGREDDRSDKIESKAFKLIGIPGIATGFITGFAGLLLEREKLALVPVLIVAAALYVLVVLALMFTIYLAVKVVTVGDYVFTYPSANDIFELSKASLEYVKRERAASLFYSFTQNQQVVNRKATYLSGAQLWFRNSVVLLLVLTLLLALYAPFKSSAPVPGASMPTVRPTVSVQPRAIPTDTLQPTSTLTVVASTDTPAAAPTATIGSSPTITITPTQ
ncbi:MAG: hypothetical protein H8D43_02650 [Chloroflexi bacterium]|nr:hypothetical protein [Chloroflexota bacterium]